MASKTSPFAPKTSPEMPRVAGIRLAACEAGIRYRDRKDLMLVVMDADTTAAGVLTRSRTASAPVEWCRARLPNGDARALVVNSGNANAFTGRKGDEATRLTAEAVGRAVGCDADQVFAASTGVIGEPLDVTVFADRLEALAGEAGPDDWHDAAAAILTTDTFAKLATRTARVDGVDVTINGIAKGSGMIAPDMATMLAFVFTDAAVRPEALQAMLAGDMGDTFNAITVDGDTSTSDTVLAFATGAARAGGAGEITAPDEPRAAAFAAAFHDLLLDLALQVVKDGEGLSKFAEIVVQGAETVEAARRIGRSIANSPLVKTALAGEDPNWGRIVMAVGKAGEAADRDRLAIWFGDILVAENGEVAAGYRESDGAGYMKNDTLRIIVDVGVGRAEATTYTCDLTKEYVAINADYRS